MDSLTDEQVRHLGQLARLELSDEEVALFGQQLSSIIDYNMSLLEEADVDEITPTSQTSGLQNQWRDDQIEPSLPVKTVMSQAPRHDGNQFVVPAVLDEG